MNLSITPVNFNNYSAAKNCNNQSQKFEGLQARVFRHPEDGRDILNAIRKRDMVVDRFLAKFEEVAETLGVNTDKMDQQGYSLEFVPKFAFSSKMSAMLKNKSQNFVEGRDRLPIMVDLKRGNELEQAEELAYVIKGANLDKIS